MIWSRTASVLSALAACALATACDKGFKSPTAPSSSSPVVCEATLYGKIGQGTADSFEEAKNAAVSDCMKRGSTSQGDYFYRQDLGECRYTLRCTANDGSVSLGPWYACISNITRTSTSNQPVQFTWKTGGPNEAAAFSDALQLCQLWGIRASECEPVRTGIGASCTKSH
ncbi:MAG TPA: hypothetical protein VM598_12940 [Bdellovibrionota bacterium]|nr:hypothetical protein [Bdellovibrionota bacterium]